MKNRIFIIIIIVIAIISSFGQTKKDSKLILKKRFEFEACIFETDSGNFEIMLYENDAPTHAKNFRNLVKSGFYKNVSFHRVINDFVIQAGIPKLESTVKRDLLNPEIQKLHGLGSVGAARLDDNVNKKLESNPTQFYICLKPQPDLNRKYTVFGRVSKGMDVVLKIGKVATDKNNRPLKNINIRNCYLASRFDNIKYEQFLKFKSLDKE